MDILLGLIFSWVWVGWMGSGLWLHLNELGWIGDLVDLGGTFG